MYFLGYDGTCGTCATIAEEVQAQLGDELQVIPLGDERMQEWRRLSLGSEAPWVPTLVRVDGRAVQAWTGPEMSIRLAKTLGPSRALAVLRIVTRAISPHNSEVQGLRRRGLLKLATASAVGALVLGRAPAMAGQTSTRDQKGKTSKELTQKELALVLASGAAAESLYEVPKFSPEADSLVGEVISLSKLDGASLASTIGPNKAEKGGSTQRTRGVRHSYKDGTTEVLVSTITETGVILLRFDEVDGDVSLQEAASFLADDQKEEVSFSSQILKDGEVIYEPMASGCSSNSQCGSSYCWACKCTSWNKTCIKNCCGPCASSVFWLKALLACALIWCNWCVSDLGNSCCNSRACRYRAGTNC